MKIYTLDKREIKNLRLKYRLNNVKKIFETEKSFGLFIMSETLQPKDHINKREILNKNNIKLFNISKKIGRFVTNDKKWSSIRNLIAGNVILVTNKNKNEIIPTENLNTFLTKSESLPRFLFWNEALYREKDILKYMQIKQTNVLLNLVFLIKKIALKPLFITFPFIKYKNK